MKRSTSCRGINRLAPIVMLAKSPDRNSLNTVFLLTLSRAAVSSTVNSKGSAGGVVIVWRPVGTAK
jgi:hypothetical protein